MVKRFACMLLLLHAWPAWAAQDVLIETELEPAQVRAQEQAMYRLRVLHAVDLRELRIAGPSARLADVRALDGERVFEVQRGGRRYRVHERSYAVLPFASGALELSGAYVTGRTATHAVRLEAPSRSITVLPIDNGSAGTAAIQPPAPVPRIDAVSVLPAATSVPGAALASLLALLLYRRRTGLRIAWQLRRAAGARAMRDCLLQAAAAIWRDAPPATLGALAERLDNAEARDALSRIERRLYGPASAAGDAAALRPAARTAGRAIAMMAARRIIR